MKPKKLIHFDSFWKDPVIRLGIAAFLILWLSSTGMLAWWFGSLPPVVPFFYSMIRGPLQLAEKRFLFLLPLMSLVFSITHLIFARLYYTSDLVFSRIMVVSTALGSFLFAVAIWHILWIVL